MARLESARREAPTLPLAEGGPSGPDGAPALKALSTATILLLFGMLAALAVRQVQTVDIGFHLKTGEYILATKSWPRTDSFTFTVRDHPYINASWGYDVLVALTNRAAGAPGLALLHAGLALAIFVVLWRTLRLGPADPAVLSAGLWLGILAAELRFVARPELLSVLLLAAVLYILQRRAVGRRTPLWALAPLLFVWANVHGAFVVGFAAEICFVAGLAWRERRVDRRLLTWSAISVGATLVNPYGWQVLAHALTLATRFQQQNVFAQTIGELASPFWLPLSTPTPFFPRSPIIAFRALALVSVAGLIPALKRRRVEALLLWVVFMALAAPMLRNVPLFVVAALPAVVWRPPGDGLVRRLGGGARTRAWIRGAVLAVVGLASIVVGLRAVHDAHYIASRRVERFGLGWNSLALPVDAADFALRAGLRGPVLNDLAFGGYLMWRLPDPVFIDSRLEVMGERFFEDYRQATGSTAALEATVARWGIRWLIFQHTFNGGLLARLSADERWRLVYADGLSAIFVRAGPDALSIAPVLPLPPRRVIHALPGLGGGPRVGALRRWLRGVLVREEFPAEEFNFGLFHFFRGELDAAAARFARAIERSGGAYYEMYFDLGLALDGLGRRDEARACFAVVLQDDPRNPTALERVGAPPARSGA